jgi:hypothetical protein
LWGLSPPDRSLGARGIRLLGICILPFVAFGVTVLGTLPPADQMVIRPFRFKIATLLWLTLVVSVALFLSRAFGPKGIAAGVSLSYVVLAGYFVVRMEQGDPATPAE